MKKPFPFWIFFTVALFCLLGLVTSYTLDLPMMVQGGFLAGLILAVLLQKVRMGLGAVDNASESRKESLLR